MVALKTLVIANTSLLNIPTEYQVTVQSEIRIKLYLWEHNLQGTAQWLDF